MEGTTPEIKDPSTENRAHEGFLGTPCLLLQQNKYLFNARSVYKTPSTSQPSAGPQEVMKRKHAVCFATRWSSCKDKTCAEQTLNTY